MQDKIIMDKQQSQGKIDYKWTIIIVLILIVLWAWSVRGDSDSLLVSHISLASSLTSILLSVIAILYTLWQSFSTSKKETEIITATTQLSRASKQMGLLLKQIEQQKQMFNDVQYMRHQVDTLVSNTSNPTLKPTDADYEKLFSYFISRISTTGLITVYLLLKISEHPLNESFGELVNKVFDSPQYLELLNTNYCYGLAMGIEAIGIFAINGKSGPLDPWTVIVIDPWRSQLLKMIEREVQTRKVVDSIVDTWKNRVDGLFMQ